MRSIKHHANISLSIDLPLSAHVPLHRYHTVSFSTGTTVNRFVKRKAGTDPNAPSPPPLAGAGGRYGHGRDIHLPPTSDIIAPHKEEDPSIPLSRAALKTAAAPPLSLLMVWYYHVLRPVLLVGIPIPLRVVGLWLKEVSHAWVPLVRREFLRRSCCGGSSSSKTGTQLSDAALDFLHASPLGALLKDVQYSLEKTQSSSPSHEKNDETIELLTHLGAACVVVVVRYRNNETRTLPSDDAEHVSLPMCECGSSCAALENDIFALIPVDCGIQYDELRKRCQQLGSITESQRQRTPLSHENKFSGDDDDNDVDSRHHYYCELPVPVFTIILRNPQKFVVDVCSRSGLVVYRNELNMARNEVMYQQVLRRRGIVGVRQYQAEVSVATSFSIPSRSDGGEGRSVPLLGMFDMGDEAVALPEVQTSSMRIITGTSPADKADGVMLSASPRRGGGGDAAQWLPSSSRCEQQPRIGSVTLRHVREGLRLARVLLHRGGVKKKSGISRN
jgi:hypothetical protein